MADGVFFFQNRYFGIKLCTNVKQYTKNTKLSGIQNK